MRVFSNILSIFIDGIVCPLKNTKTVVAGTLFNQNTKNYLSF